MLDGPGVNDGENAFVGFRFEVDFGMKLRGVSFQEVSGMNNELRIQDYLNPHSTVFSSAYRQGSEKNGNVTLRRGIFSNDDHFWKWMDEVKESHDLRYRTVLIKLIDESGKITVQWQLNKARPVRVSGTDIGADGNAVAVDVVEIAHEQLIVCTGLVD